MRDYILLFPIFFPMLCGFFMPLLQKKRFWETVLFALLAVETAVVFYIAFNVDGDMAVTVWQISGMLSISFFCDGLGRIFSCLISGIWLMAAIFSMDYMKKEEHVGRFFFFYLISLGVLLGISYSANFMTMYLFYEFMTLMTVPLVLHSETQEAITAGLKYMGYSIFGAGLGLIGFFFLCVYGSSTEFTPGGVLDPSIIAGHESVLRIIYFEMIIGFGCKAGMYPLHAWLPTAHPVAPAPASAVLSGLITKCGVLAIIRTTYYLFGVDFVRGTWAQTALLCLAVFTIFMGSMLAYKENLLKKRLAYSTISQVSYVLFGVFLMTPQALSGALLQVIGHAIAKNTLFLSSGAIINRTGKKYVSELTGIGKSMPVVMLCFTVASLSLVGIPPTAGFISKWYLAEGALDCSIGNIIPILGIFVLILSALLTAGYLFTIVVKAFFPGSGFNYEALSKKEPGAVMLFPLIVLSACILFFGMFPSGFVNFFTEIFSGIF